MKLMKFLKNIFLLVMIFLFIAAGVLLQSVLVLENTLFSENYFQKTLDENDVGNNISKLVEGVIDNNEKFIPINNIENDIPTEITPEAQKLINSYKTMMKQNIDMNWIRTETPKTINGIYGYFLLGNEKLPVINIKPVKEIYVNLFAQQIIMNSNNDVSKQTDEIITYIKYISQVYSKDDRVNDTLIDEIMKLDQFKTMNLSRESVTRVVNKIVNSDSIKSEELYEYIVTEMIKDKLDFYGMNEIKDELDLNLLFNTKYGDKYNPVKGAAVMIDGIKKDVFMVIVMLYILLFLIIAVTAYSPKSILRWSGVGMLISGIMGMMSYRVTELVNSNIISRFQGLKVEEKGLDIAFVQNWVLSYTNGIWKGIFICALIFAMIGVIFITASFFINSLFKKISVYSGMKRILHICKEKKSLIMSLRIVVVLILLIVIPVNTAVNINRIRASVEEYNIIKEKAKINARDTNEALGKVLNAEKFMKIMK